MLQGSFLAGVSVDNFIFFAYNYGVQRRTGFGTFPRGIRPLWARDGFFFIVCIHVAIALLVIIPTNKTCDFHKLNLVCLYFEKHLYYKQIVRYFIEIVLIIQSGVLSS